MRIRGRSVLGRGAAIVVGLCLITGGTAEANIVTFDDAVGNGLANIAFGPGGSFSDQGLNFTNNGAGYEAVWGPNSPNGNGTNSKYFCFHCYR
jgi:hypothetical protein